MIWADQIIYGRIKFLWADTLSLTEFINIMEKPLLNLVGIARRPVVPGNTKVRCEGQ
jgi:hypothetical protein